jgi:hypothetical protein
MSFTFSKKNIYSKQIENSVKMKIKENTKYKHCLMNLHTSLKSNSKKKIVVRVFASQKANKPTTNTDQFNSLLVKIMFFKLNSQGNP